MWIMLQSLSSLIGLNRLEATHCRENIFSPDFLMATDPATFLIRIILPKAFQSLEAICLDNDKTKERFQTKMEEAQENWEKDKLMLQISRYPLASTKKLIVFSKEYYEKTIDLTKELQIVPI
jgi:hypothetical protein